MNLKKRTQLFYEKLTPLKPTVVYLNKYSVRKPDQILKGS